MVFISPDHKVLFLRGYVKGCRLTCLRKLQDFWENKSWEWSNDPWKKGHTPLKANMTLENPNVQRKHIFKWWIFQPVILVLRGVYWRKELPHVTKKSNMNYSQNGWINARCEILGVFLTTFLAQIPFFDLGRKILIFHHEMSPISLWTAATNINYDEFWRCCFQDRESILVDLWKNWYDHLPISCSSLTY